MDAGFLERYDAVMAKWPVPYEGIDLESRFGTTHVNACGAEGAPPVILLPGGRSTSAVWYATVGVLAPHRRVYAIDTLGDAGRSVASGDPLRTLDAVMAWLDATIDGFGIGPAAVVGHSLGAYFATRYALHAPDRVERLALLDPTLCFTGNRVPFMIRALPIILGRGRNRFRSFAMWETRGRPIDPEVLELFAGRYGGVVTGVFPKRPTATELAALTMPLLVFTASESRQNDTRKLMTEVRKLPSARVVEIIGASHFMLPQEFPEQVNPPLAEFVQIGFAA